MSDIQQYPQLYPDGTESPKLIGHINHIRFRSGMIGNVLGIGVRRNLDATTKVNVHLHCGRCR